MLLVGPDSASPRKLQPALRWLGFVLRKIDVAASVTGSRVAVGTGVEPCDYGRLDEAALRDLSVNAWMLELTMVQNVATL